MTHSGWQIVSRLGCTSSTWSYLNLNHLQTWIWNKIESLLSNGTSSLTSHSSWHVDNWTLLLIRLCDEKVKRFADILILLEVSACSLSDSPFRRSGLRRNTTNRAARILNEPSIDTLRVEHVEAIKKLPTIWISEFTQANATTQRRHWHGM